MKATPVPAFAVGQIDEPLAYIHNELPLLGKRLGLTESDLNRFVATGIASAEACVPHMTPERFNLGMVHPVPESRTFWNLIGDIAVSQDSTINGFEHFLEAEHLREEGYNVVLVQNHRSGADMLSMETLLRRSAKTDVCTDWSYMSGHVVNIYLIPLMFAAAFRRFQIFSVKYQSTGVAGLNTETMQRQNYRAMDALREHVSPGGTFTVYYPEGGRGTGEMMRGEARTSCILRNIAHTGKSLIILPTNIAGAESLLPQARGENEFNEALHHMRAGRVALNIGKPITWEYLNSTVSEHEHDRHQWYRALCDTLLALVARLGPEHEAGIYSADNPYVQQILSHFPMGGVLR